MAQGSATPEMKSRELERELERIERFKRVAAHRANKALDYIDSLTRTADRSRYHYSEKQVGEILTKLRQATDQLEAAYLSKHDKRPRVEL
jgi:hypothetical protein